MQSGLKSSSTVLIAGLLPT